MASTSSRACAPARRATTTTDEEDEFLEPSLDAFWKITPSLTAALTLNPDFSGTTADTRQINLTRFDLFFPEQRAFFLQDSDIFEFGGLEEESGIPFFSRRIGLDDDGEALTLDAGAQARRPRGPAQHRRARRAPGCGRRAGIRGSLRRPRRGERARGIERRRHRRRAAIPTRASTTALVGVDFRYLNTRLGEDRSIEATAWYQQTDTEGLDGDDPAYGFSFADAEQRGLERRGRPQGARGELLPRARLRGPHGFRGDVRPSSATPGARRTAGSAASRARSAPSSSSRSTAATAAAKSSSSSSKSRTRRRTA